MSRGIVASFTLLLCCSDGACVGSLLAPRKATDPGIRFSRERGAVFASVELVCCEKSNMLSSSDLGQESTSVSDVSGDEILASGMSAALPKSTVKTKSRHSVSAT